MKAIRTIAVTTMLAVLFGHSSFAKPADTPAEKLRTSVAKLLKNSGLDFSMDEKVRITFFITNDDELVVLKTDAKNNKLDRNIKTSLNYKHIRIKDLDRNRIVHIKVQFLSK